MMERNGAAVPGAPGRTTGAVYLLYFVTVISAALMSRGIIVPEDAAATAANLHVHEAVFRLSLAIDLIATGLYIAVTILFYGLFRNVSRTVALLALGLSLVGCAIQGMGSVFRAAPSVMLDGSAYLGAFNTEQVQALGMMALKLSVQATHVYLVFFGMFNFSIGYLIFKSGFLPRILGVLMALSGLGWLMFLSPHLVRQFLPIIEVLGIVAELSLMLWLLVKGVDAERWKERASLAGG
jgi:uncharacterized protein DUF4386